MSNATESTDDRPRKISMVATDHKLERPGRDPSPRISNHDQREKPAAYPQISQRNQEETTSNIPPPPITKASRNPQELQWFMT